MENIHDQLEETTNVLLAEPPMGQGRDVCTSLLCDQQPAPSVLFVTYTRSAADCVAQLDGHDDLDKVGVVTVGDASPEARDGVVTETVSSPSDLTGQVSQSDSSFQSGTDPFSSVSTRSPRCSSTSTSTRPTSFCTR
ncbi:hypothetical protein [Halovenus salina]|uniref:Uncharacterized protein n=1 Tax=Halovenus salina TaxID=1510225 RepID=A0ABD5W3A5_9EURY